MMNRFWLFVAYFVVFILVFNVDANSASYSMARGIVKVTTQDGHTYEGKSRVATNYSLYKLRMKYQGIVVEVPIKNIRSVTFTKSESPQTFVITLKDGKLYNANWSSMLIPEVRIEHDLGEMIIPYEKIKEIEFINMQ